MAADFERLVVFVPARHDHEDIDVTALMRLAVGVGAKEDDFVGLEAIGNIAREAANDGHGNISAVIPAGGLGWLRQRVRFCHNRILAIANAAVLPVSSRDQQCRFRVLGRREGRLAPTGEQVAHGVSDLRSKKRPQPGSCDPG